MRAPIVSLLCLIAAACQMPTASREPYRGGASDPEASPLAARGARPIEQEPSESALVVQDPRHDELIAERDRLRAELESLRAELAQLSAELEDERTRAATRILRVSKLEREIQQLARDKHELALRLTQAQVGRLEAEKLLLETRLARRREDDVSGAGSGERGTDR